jgi:hypothetical protein
LTFYNLCWVLFHLFIFYLIIVDLGTYRFYDEYQKTYEFGAYESGTVLFIVLFPIVIILVGWLTFRKGMDEIEDLTRKAASTPSMRTVLTIGILTFVWVIMWFINSYVWLYMNGCW